MTDCLLLFLVGFSLGFASSASRRLLQQGLVSHLLTTTTAKAGYHPVNPPKPKFAAQESCNKAERGGGRARQVLPCGYSQHKSTFHQVSTTTETPTTALAEAGTALPRTRNRYRNGPLSLDRRQLFLFFFLFLTRYSAANKVPLSMRVCMCSPFGPWLATGYIGFSARRKRGRGLSHPTPLAPQLYLFALGYSTSP